MWRDACWDLTPSGRSGQARAGRWRRAQLSEGDGGTKLWLGQAGWGVGLALPPWANPQTRQDPSLPTGWGLAG